MKKAIFFDIDGTIITEDERAIIPESTKKAIIKARENGHLAFINTGRTFFNISDELKKIGFDGYLCGCGTYIEYDEKVIVYNKLEQEFCRKISGIIKKCRAYPVYERMDCVFFDKDALNHPGIQYIKDIFFKDNKNKERYCEETDFSFDKFVIWTDEETDTKNLFEEIGRYFKIIDRDNGFYENVPRGFSKATAVDIILEKTGISYENAYAIGDSMNDLSMLESVPNSIAMGGAEKLYPYVSFITKSIDEDGIEHALRHFEII